jgi:hypothetical protein
LSTSPSFEKIAECLYRNPSSRAYYALLKVKGKQHKRSLKTTDLAEAKRKLRDYRAEVEQTTPKAGKTTVREVCQKYRRTIQDQAESTRVNKEIMLDKVEQHWGETLLRNLKKGDILEWLASLKLGTSWRNQHLRVLRAALRLAVDDGIIYRSPLEGVAPDPGHADLSGISGHRGQHPFPTSFRHGQGISRVCRVYGIGRAWPGRGIFSCVGRR